AIGIGAAGWIDAKRRTSLFAPNLAWRNEPLRDEVARHVSVPVVVENDANAAAWAEFQYGAAADATDSMAMFTVGTGIGGALVLGGELIRGAHGIAGELGHTTAVPDGHPCGCGKRGCIEQYASGSALVRFARATALDTPERASTLLELAGGHPEAINGPMVTAAARAGDPAALDAFAQIGYWLGGGLADLVQIVDPQVLVVGGGVIDAGDLLLAPARVAYEQALAQRRRPPGRHVGGAPSLGNVICTDLRVRPRGTWEVRYPLTPGRHLRGAAFARCTAGGAPFVVVGSHLATDPAERPGQAQLLKKALADLDVPVIL